MDASSKTIKSVIDHSIKQLYTANQSNTNTGIEHAKVGCHSAFPSHDRLIELVNCVRDICFPNYFGYVSEDDAEHKLRDCFYRIYSILPDQIYFGVTFCKGEAEHLKEESKRLAIQFMEFIPHIKELLLTDAQATFRNDPAAHSIEEVVLCYPAIRAMLHHRIAHQLYLQKIPILPRMISEMAHAQTGIDIHPGASIGKYFAIDHGTGVVIGKTCIIGDYVRIYQGVTLGSKNFASDDNGNLLDIPRHPILENNVTVYSNASILGRVTIGESAVIGGNVWITNDVPPHSRIVQQRAISSTFSDGAGI